MSGYFSRIVQRSQPGAAALARPGLYAAPVEPAGAEGASEAADLVGAVTPDQSNLRAGLPGPVGQQPLAAPEFPHLVKPERVPSPERFVERATTGTGTAVTSRVERVSTEKTITDKVEPADRQMGRQAAVAPQLRVSLPHVAAWPSPVEPGVVGQVTPNGSPERPLAPAAHAPGPALVIGKITVEVQAPQKPVVTASANRNRRAARPAAPARRTMEGPSRLGFGFGQL